MSRLRKITYWSLGIFVVLAGLYMIVTASENRRLESERARIHGLIHAGQNINDAQSTLEQAGYSFAYEAPISPVASSDYTQQLVVIGDTSHDFLDTFFYVMGWGNPFFRQSPYVIIQTDTNQIIYKID